MNADKVLKWAGIGALVYFLVQGVGSAIYNRIKVGAARLKLGQVQPTGIQVEITQPITNENPVSFNMDYMEADVLYGNNKLAKVSSSSPVTIQANNTTELKFNTFLDFSDVVGGLADILSTGQYLQALRIKGYVASEGVIVPFEHTVTVG